MQAETGGTVCSPFPDSTIIKTNAKLFGPSTNHRLECKSNIMVYFNKKLQGNFRED
jgi:hypothetical protein